MSYWIAILKMGIILNMDVSIISSVTTIHQNKAIYMKYDSKKLTIDDLVFDCGNQWINPYDYANMQFYVYDDKKNRYIFTNYHSKNGGLVILTSENKTLPNIVLKYGRN